MAVNSSFLGGFLLSSLEAILVVRVETKIIIVLFSLKFSNVPMGNHRQNNSKTKREVNFFFFEDLSPLHPFQSMFSFLTICFFSFMGG